MLLAPSLLTEKRLCSSSAHSSVLRYLKNNEVLSFIQVKDYNVIHRQAQLDCEPYSSVSRNEDKGKSLFCIIPSLVADGSPAGYIMSKCLSTRWINIVQIDIPNIVLQLDKLQNRLGSSLTKSPFPIHRVISSPLSSGKQSSTMSQNQGATRASEEHTSTRTPDTPSDMYSPDLSAN